ncbi:hypothetical protein LRU_02071 [Ligilactobacillus ruminis SPM0211]|uniref:HTH cro/C1-type domain-containing protein n=1 Tax=Ligilactobacillus ruminis SPM0211 TaxID=1040964 RepID=F7R2W8_9LACO|nr:Rgg/GadR/MutR family transcriptional regulator [Ligilactobacillus ruminis]EGM50389.1 hypothetical protein LRU_02071 [Ligilactobacillus ruminis SPM0211]
MIENLGKTLRIVRKNKKVSINKIADNYLSKSQISRFERGESEITCTRLFNILDKLNITVDEFLSLHNSHDVNFIALIKYIREEYSLQNYKNIKKLLKNNSKFNIGTFERTMIKSILYTVDPSFKPSNSELSELIDYLFKVENFGYYEIILLGNCAYTLPYPSFFLLTKELIKNYIPSTQNKTNKKFVTQVSINCLISSIDNKKFKNCDFLIKEINYLLDNELNYYEKTVFHYVKGYYEYVKGMESGITKMSQAITIFNILNEKSMLNYYTAHYKKIINGKNL